MANKLVLRFLLATGVFIGALVLFSFLGVHKAQASATESCAFGGTSSNPIVNVSWNEVPEATIGYHVRSSAGNFDTASTDITITGVTPGYNFAYTVSYDDQLTPFDSGSVYIDSCSLATISVTSNEPTSWSIDGVGESIPATPTSGLYYTYPDSNGSTYTINAPSSVAVGGYTYVLDNWTSVTSVSLRPGDSGSFVLNYNRNYWPTLVFTTGDNVGIKDLSPGGNQADPCLNNGSCTAVYSNPTTVTISITSWLLNPDGTVPYGYSVLWTGDCYGVAGPTDTSCTIPVGSGEWTYAGAAIAWTGGGGGGGGGGTNYNLTVTKLGTGSGTVTSTPSGINCPIGSCSNSFPENTLINLRALADSTSIFRGWSAPDAGNEIPGCTGTTTTPCTFNLTHTQFINATFEKYYRKVVFTINGKGSVSFPADLEGKTSCDYTGCTAFYPNYGSDTEFTFGANPEIGYIFGSWDQDCVGLGEFGCSLQMGSDHAITANFVATNYTLTVKLNGSGTVKLPADINGDADCSVSTCTRTYPARKPISAFAVPAPFGWTFSWWSSACTGTDPNTCSFTMTGAKTLNAFFAPPSASYPLSVSVIGTGGGNVASNPAGINCPGTCASTYTAGTSVTLTATPNSSSNFGGWNGACLSAGLNPTCTVQIWAAATVSARFDTTSKYYLDVTTAGTGTGMVKVSIRYPDGAQSTLAVTSAMVHSRVSFDQAKGPGTTITLQGTADSGSTWVGWSGTFCGGTGDCMFQMDKNYNITATFNSSAATYPLNITVAGVGTGKVVAAKLTQDSSGNFFYAPVPSINCVSGSMTNCSGTFLAGDSIMLFAQAGSSSIFGSWASSDPNSCNGSSNTMCALTMTQPRNITANFLKNTYDLTLTGITGSGQVAFTPPGVSCNTSCTQTYIAGTSVLLIAVPGANYQFSSWGGVCAGSPATCTVPMNADKSVSVTFVPILGQPLDVKALPGSLCQTVDVSFTDNSIGEDEFYIYRDNDNNYLNGATLVITLPSNTSSTVGQSYSFTDTVVPPGTYFYEVVAHKISGNIVSPPGVSPAAVSVGECPPQFTAGIAIKEIARNGGAPFDFAPDIKIRNNDVLTIDILMNNGNSTVAQNLRTVTTLTSNLRYQDGTARVSRDGTTWSVPGSASYSGDILSVGGLGNLSSGNIIVRFKAKVVSTITNESFDRINANGNAYYTFNGLESSYPYDLHYPMVFLDSNTPSQIQERAP